MKRVILFLVIGIFSFSCLSCTKEKIILPITNNETASLPDFEFSYKLILKKTNESVGNSSIKVRSLKRQDKIFYTINQYTKVRKTEYTNSLIMQSVSTADANFKIIVFQSKIVENKKTSIRKGYYNSPYYYIEADSKTSRLKASKPLYSSIVEHYIMRKILIKPSDTVSYFFFNIVSLEAEEESISFEKENKRSKEYEMRNHRNDYTSFYKLDKDYRLIEKTDFNNLILWKLKE